MNERIKELKEQAVEYAMAVHEGHIVPPLGKEVWPIGNVFDEKFAELIVRECAKVLEIQGANTGHEQYYYGASLIEEHFGVEE